MRYVVTLCLATLALLAATESSAQAPSRQRGIEQWNAPRKIDKSKLARQGFRVLDSRHATLVTDLPSSPAVDELPAVVDAAVPLLAQRFAIDPRQVRDWHVLVMLLDDRQRFATAGLMPVGHEQFPHGLSMGYELWVANQSSDYYRRHLMLHELTHSFMATRLGSCGPGWYMEGMAELLGTHTWQPRTGKLQLGIMPGGRAGFDMWGRTKLVRTAVADNRLLPIPSVMAIDNSKILEVESYAWVWALSKWLDTHPRYRQRFRQLQSRTMRNDFDKLFRKQYADDWSDLSTEWRLFATTLTYNHDISAESIDFPQRADAVRSLDTPARANISATRGWQSTGVLVEAGESYEVKASGRFVVGTEPDGTPWIAEPGGITLQYHAGYPLGQLLGVVDPRPLDRSSLPTQPPGTSAFLTPTPLGTQATLTPKQSGVLYLRLNDSPGELTENRGNAAVSVRRIP